MEWWCWVWVLEIGRTSGDWFNAFPPNECRSFYLHTPLFPAVCLLICRLFCNALLPFFDVIWMMIWKLNWFRKMTVGVYYFDVEKDIFKTFSKCLQSFLLATRIILSFNVLKVSQTKANSKTLKLPKTTWSDTDFNSFWVEPKQKKKHSKALTKCGTQIILRTDNWSGALINQTFFHSFLATSACFMVFLIISLLW